MNFPRLVGSKLAGLTFAALLLGGCSLWPVDKRALAANAHIRESALKSIQRMSAGERAMLVSPLLTALASQDDRINHRAAVALAAVGEPAVDALIQKTGASDPYMRTLALNILGNIGSPSQKIGPVLVSGLEDAHPLVREEAAHALGELGHQATGAVPALIQTLSDSNPDVHDAALQALKKIGVKDADLPQTPLKTS